MEFFVKIENMHINNTRPFFDEEILQDVILDN